MECIINPAERLNQQHFILFNTLLRNIVFCAPVLPSLEGVKFMKTFRLLLVRDNVRHIAISCDRSLRKRQSE
ncbi:hypothetical protein HA502_26375 [Klebsiella pneumoniae]|uniref:Uncharacterized protein n=1 Tax=Klebsiella pneumoniae TaxID=573 RepID=A0A5P1PKN3_KLEPN|nr:hypothetical protein [Klebsiella pneumoniae]NQE43717.1 hypothetical protein [Klebsiella pneumoniae subsp. pneumoniae]VGP35596.1 hypothetical protein SB00610_01939 [Klebsiella quasipneumoniae subsp. similipneumoniae]AYB68726.1 hypothetical protein D0898_27490 [Klebsiella pneumoniae]MBH8515377.1 hypothetical protein [Klebsiella pneumoniae]MCB8867751.1 hypothetical protein [Klebsiella pneumoniae]